MGEQRAGRGFLLPGPPRLQPKCPQHQVQDQGERAHACKIPASPSPIGSRSEPQLRWFQAGKTLSVRKWHAAFTREGCLDIASVLSRIQRGVRTLLPVPVPAPAPAPAPARDLNRLCVCLLCFARVSTLPSGEKFGSSCLAAMTPGAPSMSGNRLGTGGGTVTTLARAHTHTL
jgi:hypothetical protein